MDRPTIVAIAGAYAERIRLRHIRDNILIPSGIRVRAEWLTSTVERDEDLTDEERGKWSTICLNDIWAADVLLYFPTTTDSKGRHSDFGAALIINRPIIIVGARERNIHHYHPNVMQVELERLVETLAALHLVDLLSGR